ncbi:hypothetical protein [Marisediminicola sp. LYQ134]|uniref:hypothetical protein n=1 Tax=Marisediminicola sp. LYQ134 TaxID=3391061 RepID=UPI003982F2CA
MGNNDDREMLESARAECIRLEGQLTIADGRARAAEQSLAEHLLTPHSLTLDPDEVLLLASSIQELITRADISTVLSADTRSLLARIDGAALDALHADRATRRTPERTI